MELTVRQAKTLAALARKFARGEIKDESAEKMAYYLEAIGPVLRDAILEAAPEIKKPAAAQFGKGMICGAAMYLTAAKAKTEAKKAAPKHGHPCTGCPKCSGKTKPAAKKTAKKPAPKKGGKKK